VNDMGRDTFCIELKDRGPYWQIGDRWEWRITNGGGVVIRSGHARTRRRAHNHAQQEQRILEWPDPEWEKA